MRDRAGASTRPLLPGALLLLLSATAGAQQGYTSRAAFLAALPGPQQAVNFDAVAAGTTYASGQGTGGITFVHGLGGTPLKVTGAYPATSGANALGTTDADILQDGDNITFTFTARNAFGITLITREALQAADLTLASGPLSATVDATAVQGVLADGSNVYFLGIIHPTAAFTSASLQTVGGGYFFYNVDDLVSATAVDTDGDGIADGADNCRLQPNGNLVPDAGGGSQRDTDGDGYGNRCDGDLNNSGSTNAADLALFRNAFGNPANPAADFNGNGSVNAADLAIFRTLFGAPPGPSGLHP